MLKKGLLLKSVAFSSLIIVIVVFGDPVVTAQPAGNSVQQPAGAQQPTGGGDLVGAAEGLVIAVATLLSTVSGIVILAINARRNASKQDLTERDKQIISIAKWTQVGSQKAVENIGEVRNIVRIMLDNLPSEKRAELEKELKPML